ncbi:hypothetical protein T492DRAFT_858565 [Pavlovales sp. CCMP2436]|nr:hypothetical protein T492DRAFT_858565 [Pavlovales sp. CCMP2436]
MADADPTSLPLEPEPLAERPLAIKDSTSGITCTSATLEAICGGCDEPGCEYNTPIGYNLVRHKHGHGIDAET